MKSARLQHAGRMLLAWLFVPLLVTAAWANDAARVRSALTFGRPALVEFGAETCRQCRRMKVVLDGIERRYRGRAHIVQINVNKERALTREFRIMVIPTRVFSDASGKEAGRHYGFLDEVKGMRRLHELGAR